MTVPAAATAPRSSLRTRTKPVSYAQPSLRAKLRKGDPFTFGAAEAAAKAIEAAAAAAGGKKVSGQQSEAGGSGKLPPAIAGS